METVLFALVNAYNGQIKLSKHLSDVMVSADHTDIKMLFCSILGYNLENMNMS